MTNEIESVTNVVNVVTQSHITPQAVAYDFKQWAGVISTIATSLYAGLHICYVMITKSGGLRNIWQNILGPKQPRAAVENKTQ